MNKKIEKLFWTKKEPKVCVFRFAGDIWCGFEGSEPMKVRELIKLFYKEIEVVGKLSKSEYLLNKTDLKWFRKHKELLESITYK